MTEATESILGYSGFDLFEECYGYDEDACHVADTEESARRFMVCATLTGDYRIESVTLRQIMSDYGSSLGEFAMEPRALERFRAAATAAGVQFETRPSDLNPAVTIVQVRGVQSRAE
jgi:hypothetical protein